MKGFMDMFGSDRRIFAGKQRLHGEPFCPFLTNDTGYQALQHSRTTLPPNSGALGNTGSFSPIIDYNQKRPGYRQRF